MCACVCVRVCARVCRTCAHTYVSVELPELLVGDGWPSEGKSHTEGSGVTDGD